MENKSRVLSRRMIFVTSVITFFLGVENGGFQLVLVDLAEEYSLNASKMGSMVSVQYAAMLIFPLLFGHISDRVGKKRVILAFMPLLVAGSLLVGGSHAIVLCAAGLFLIGAGYSICECLSSAAMSDADPIHAEKNMSLAQSFYSIGAMTGPLVVSALLGRGLGWRIAFWIVALAFAGVFFLTLSTRFSADSPAHTAGESASPAQADAPAPSLLCPAFFLLIFLLFCYVWLENGLSFFVKLFFRSELRAAAAGTYALSAFWLAMAVSRFSFGVLRVNPEKAVCALFAASAAALGALALTPSPTLALVFCICAGLTLGPVWPMLVGMGARRFSAQSGTAASILMSAGSLSGACAPPLCGMIADAASLRISLAILAALALLGGIFCAKGLRKAPGKQPA